MLLWYRKRERMGPGGLRGLQIRCPAARAAGGAFDSHTLPPGLTRMSRDDRLVHLATAPNEPIADMWAGLLQGEGIRALVQPMGAAAYFGPSVPCRLMVREIQLEAARRVLEGGPVENDQDAGPP